MPGTEASQALNLEPAFGISLTPSEDGSIRSPALSIWRALSKHHLERGLAEEDRNRFILTYETKAVCGAGGATGFL